jgi:hypothetical protein
MSTSHANSCERQSVHARVLAAHSRAPVLITDNVPRVRDGYTRQGPSLRGRRSPVGPPGRSVRNRLSKRNSASGSPSANDKGNSLGTGLGDIRTLRNSDLSVSTGNERDAQSSPLVGVLGNKPLDTRGSRHPDRVNLTSAIGERTRSANSSPWCSVRHCTSAAQITP